MSWDEIMADKDLYESVLNEYWHNDSVSPISGKPLPADASEAETAERPDAGLEPGGQGFEEDPDRDPLDIGERNREDLSADSQERQAPSAADNGDDAGSDRGHGRLVLDDVPGPAEGRGRDEGSAEEPSRRSRADAAERPSRVEGAAIRERAARDSDAQEQSAENQSEGRNQVAEPVRERPRVQEQEHEPNARLDTGAEQTDEQRWAAIEQRMQSAMDQKLEAALDGIKADYEAKLDEQKAEHKAETESIKADYEAKIEGLTARLEAVETDRRAESGYLDYGNSGPETGLRDAVDPDRRGDKLVVGESEDDTAVLADADDIDEMWVRGSDREAPRISGRSILSPEDAELAKSAAGVLGSLGVSIPGMDLLTGGDSTRKAIEKMPPEGQLRAMRMAENFGILSSSMPPETAAVAFAASLLGPGLYAKSRDGVRDFVQKIRPKE